MLLLEVSLLVLTLVPSKNKAKCVAQNTPVSNALAQTRAQQSAIGLDTPLAEVDKMINKFLINGIIKVTYTDDQVYLTVGGVEFGSICTGLSPTNAIKKALEEHSSAIGKALFSFSTHGRVEV